MTYVEKAEHDVVAIAIRSLVKSGWLGIPSLRTLRAALALEPHVLRAALLASVASSVARRLKREQRRPDIVHAHFATSPATVAILVAKALGIPVTLVFHANDYLVGIEWRSLEAKVAAADLTFMISHTAAADLQSRLSPDLAARISVLRASAVALDAQHPHGSARLITVARLVDKKGLDDSIRVFANLLARGHQLSYDIVGDGPEMGRLRQLAEDLRVSDSVVFHGQIDHTEALALMKNARLALLLCRESQGDADGIPVFLMEAAQLAIPLVTTSVGGICELIPHNHVGLIPSGPASATVAAGTFAAERYLIEGQVAREDSLRTRERFVEEFSPERQVAKLSKHWCALVRAKRVH